MTVFLELTLSIFGVSDNEGMEIDRASNIVDETTDRGFSHPKKLFFKKNFEREIHETIFVYFSMYKRCKIISNEKQ